VGVQVGNETHKVTAFADDVTPIVVGIESISQIFNIYGKFSIESGIKLNASKTEILPIGINKNKIGTISVNNLNLNLVDKAKICGFVFSNDPNKVYEENVLNKIEKLKNRLAMWSQRNLSLQGANLIVKTFGLSQLQFSSDCINIKEKEIKTIETAIYKFLWRGRDKIKRSIMQLPVKYGGINSPSLRPQFWVNKLKAYHRLAFSEIQHPVTSSWAVLSKKRGCKDNTEMKQIDIKTYLKEVSSKSDIYDTLISSWKLYCYFFLKTLHNIIDSESNIHLNYLLVLAKSSINSLEDKNNANSINRLARFGVSQIYDLFVENKNEHKIFLDKLALKEKLNDKIADKIKANLNKIGKTEVNRMLVCIDENIFVKINRLKVRGIIFNFNNDTFDFERIANKWGLNQQYFTDFGNVFTILKNTTNDVKIKDFQYRIIHSIMSTRKMLHTYGIISNNHCITCAEEGRTAIDDIVHSFYDCPCTIDTWTNFREVTLDKLKINVKINNALCLMGIISTEVKYKIVNEAAIYVRKLLHCLVKGRKIISKNQIGCIYNNIIKMRNKIREETSLNDN